MGAHGESREGLTLMSQNLEDHTGGGGGVKGDGMGNGYTFGVWVDSQGIPIPRGYYIEDLRPVEVAPWSLRGCDAAFVQLEGMQGVVESRVQEIAPGASLPPFKAAMDEVVYVLSGQGSASV